MKLLICQDCGKPRKKKVKGKPRKGKTLCRKLLARDDLPFSIEPCPCLGKCGKGPNGRLLPADKRLHHLSIKTVKQLAAAIHLKDPLQQTTDYQTPRASPHTKT